MKRFLFFQCFVDSKLQKNNNHNNSKTGGTENEQEDAWIKKTRRIVLVSILCPIFFIFGLFLSFCVTVSFVQAE